MKNRFGLHIGKSNYSELLGYPVTIKYKNLNGAFDEAEFSLIQTEIKEPISKFQKIDLIRYNKDNQIQDRFYGVIVSDSVEKLGRADLYTHNISALEYAFMLDNYISPNITITKNTNPANVEDFYDPTILEVVERVLRINRDEHMEMIGFSIDTSTQEILRAKNSPEWTFEGETLFSILNMLFNYCNINLKFTSFETLGHFKPFEDTQEGLTEEYLSAEKSYDPTTIHSTLSTDTKNIEMSGTIIEPAFAYAKMKSIDGFEISPDNMLIETKLPISNISGLTVSPFLLATIIHKQDDNNWHIVRGYIPSYVIEDSQRNNNLMYDRTGKFKTGKDQIVLEKELYDTLDQTVEDTGIGNKLYFETGKKNIYGMSVIGKKKSWWSSKESVATKLFTKGFGRDISASRYLPFKYPQNLIAAGLDNPFMDTLDKDSAQLLIVQHLKSVFNINNNNEYELFSAIYMPTMVDMIGDTPVETEFWADYDETFFNGPKGSITLQMLKVLYTDIKTGARVYNNAMYQVKYTPITNDRLYTYREQNKGFETVPTQQNYNQTTNVASSDSIGDLLDNVSKSNSGLEKTLSFLYTDNNMLKIGSRHKDWVITGGTFNYSIDHIDVLYTFDQYYIRLNHYIGLREKWRQFEIPNEQVMKRQITRTMFAKFSNEIRAQEAGKIKDAERYLDAEPINNLFISGPIGENKNNSTYALPTTSYAVNNSIVSAAEFTSSQVIGTITIPITISGDPKNREQAIRLNLPANINLSFGTGAIGGFGDENLPLISDNRLVSNNSYYSENGFYLDSDLRERLSFALQIHNVDTTGDIFIRPLWTKINGLAGGKGISKSNVKIFTLDYVPWDVNMIPKDRVSGAQSSFMSMENSSVKVQTIVSDKNSRAVVYAIENGENYEILFFIRESVAQGERSKQRYINFSDFYTNTEGLREFEWTRLSGSVPIVDFEAEDFSDLPQPTSNHQYAKVFKREWLKVNERHKANLGYIKPLYEELPPEYHPDTKAITTGFELENITLDEYEENSHVLWVSTDETISDPTFVTDDIRKLDPPKWLETAREQRTEYKPVPTENTPYRNYSAFEELPLTTDSNYKATITNFTTKEVSKDDWDAGSYLEWSRVQDPGFYTYDVVTRAQLPAPKNTIETARINNLRWNNDSDNAVTPDYNYFDKESDLPMNILQSNVRSTVMNARLETGSSSEWDTGLSVEWARGSVVSSPDYFAKRLSNLPKVDRTGLTAKVENLNWTEVRTPSYDMHELYFWPTFKELDEDSPLDRYDDRPKSGAVTHFDLVNSDMSEWDRNIFEGKSYKNISLSGSSGNVKTSVWYYFYKQQNELFNNLGRLSEESYIIRVDSGFGYDWWRVVPTGNAGNPTYYDGIKNPTYYNSVRAQNKMRIDIKTDIFSSPTHEDVWHALERQHRNIFDNLNNAVSQEAMIRYDSGDGGYYYFHIRKDNALGIARKISVVNLQYFKGKIFNSGIRITLTGDMSGEVYPTDVWDLMSNQERYYFENLPQFYLENGIINVDTGHGGPNYFKIEPLTDPMQDLQTYAFDKYINRYYVYGRQWSVPNISLKDVPEGAEKDDLWYLIQKRESQYFDELDRFEQANGVIHMDNGYANLYYKLVPVGNTQYNQYYKMDTTIEEYYISKEKS